MAAVAVVTFVVAYILIAPSGFQAGDGAHCAGVILAFGCVVGGRVLLP